MRFSTSVMIATFSSIILAVGVVAPASANLPNLTSSAEQHAQTLAANSPGVTEKQLVSDLSVYAKSNGISLDKALSQAASDDASSKAAASKGKKGDRSVRIGDAKHKGDIFVMPAANLGVEHGHTGIFTSTKVIVEAPGSGAKSRDTGVHGYKVTKNAVKMEVKTSQAKRDKAAKHAFTKLRGKPYNNIFFNNKRVNDKKMNCSQLVWAAYKAATKIDLDGNGGPGVYPYNIKDSKHTRTYKTLK